MGAVRNRAEAAAPARQGHPRVTRQDWLRAARNALVTRGVGEVKILALAAKLKVARSSFYWYFDSRSDLLAALLREWEVRNTACIVERCRLPADNVSQAVCNFFECFVDARLFDQGLDFAVREWARRDKTVRAKIDAADRMRLDAVTALFERHGAQPAEADARARILYFMQLGYHALEVKEPMDVRMDRLEAYLKGFTGHEADPVAVATFRRLAFQHGGR
ncbi:MAG: TetR/AcrR family transcriptional regulator [Pseudomonadota bacterium]